MTSIEGDLREVPLRKVLQSISAQDGSGILTVQGEDDIVAVSFVSGAVVAADALNQTVEEGLGEALKSQGLISAEDLESSARDHAGGGTGSFGELLVRRDLVSRQDLLAGLRLQTYRLMLQILTWREGEFKFYGGDEVSYEDGFKAIPVAELLVRAVEDLGAKAGFPGPVPELDALYHQKPPSGVVRILGRDGDGTRGGIWLAPKQADFAARLDGSTSAAAVARELGLDDYEARFALYHLLHQDLIFFAGEVAPLSSLRVEQSAEEAAPLQAEIFTPPEPAAASLGEVADYEDDLIAEPRPPIPLERIVVPALAILLVIALALTLLVRPTASLLPFPWQSSQRSALERQLRQSLFLKIDRAAKVYFLVNAHYPDSLDDLVELGLLSPSDLRDPAGYPLAYSTDDVGYRIELLGRPTAAGGGAGQEIAGLGTTESITGDFLLDPQWLRPGTIEEVPLVLLD